MNAVLKNFAAVSCLIILFISCDTASYKISDTIEQRIIFPQYQVQYNAQTHQLEATVSFTVDNPAGPSVKLSDKSSITFNEEHLKFEQDDSAKRCFYRLTMDTLPKLLQFRYINDEGAIFENNLNINKLEINGGNTITISKMMGAVLNYSGQYFMKNEENEETVSCQLSRQGEEPFYFTIDILDNQQISIRDYMLYDVPTGKYTCHFVCEKSNSNIKAMDRGGLITSSYLTKTYTLIITD
jgi:hypothetical protein